MERKGDARVGRRREDGMGKGEHVEGEKCQTESKLQRAMSAAECLAALEANNEAAGRETKTTVHRCPSHRLNPSPQKKNLNIHPPSLGANTSPPFDICFSL